MQDIAAFICLEEARNTMKRTTLEDCPKLPLLICLRTRIPCFGKRTPRFSLTPVKQACELVPVHCCSSAKTHHRQQTSKCFKASHTTAQITLPSRCRWILNLAHKLCFYSQRCVTRREPQLTTNTFLMLWTASAAKRWTNPTLANTEVWTVAQYSSLSTPRELKWCTLIARTESSLLQIKRCCF